MPNSQITRTPRIIQQSWNDGLFNVREKRNGITRGNTIEEKAMYVLGIGWKFNGNTEIKDAEVENTLYVSLRGLTQEAKFLKIGQVLWEQCDEDFILKMITSLSNYTPEQSRVFQQISLKERNNFKGYFNRSSIKSINKNGLNAHAILNREAKQMSLNSSITSRNRNSVGTENKKLREAGINSKKFEKRIVHFKPSNKDINQLAEELKIVLMTKEFNNIAKIATDIGITVENGYNTKYLIEEIIEVVCTYVEIEILTTKLSSSKNVYIRQTPQGLDTIKGLLKFTHFGLLLSDEELTIEDLNSLTSSQETMRKNMKLFSNKKGKFKEKLMRKKIDYRDEFLDRSKTRELSIDKSGNKISKSLRPIIAKLLKDRVGGNMSFISSNGTITGDDAIEAWFNTWKFDIDLGSHIVGSDVSGFNVLHSLQFHSKNNIELLELFVTIAFAMGIDKTTLSLIANNKKSPFNQNDPSLYLVAIIRRQAALQREGTRFSLFGKKKRRNELADITSKIESNVTNDIKNAGKRNSKFAKNSNGIFKPISVADSGKLNKLLEKMQPVYIVGGSVYTFGGDGGSMVSPATMTLDTSKNGELSKQNRWNQVYAGTRGRKVAFERSSKGVNMMAYGTQESPVERKQGESDEAFMRRVMESKMITELQGTKKIKFNPSIQPVFLVNKGINTSNIEATALLNLIPNVLNLIPGLGTAASMAFSSLLQGQIDAAKNLPKFAVGGSFTTKNSNISQFISGDSINNRVNPERVTVDWASQRVNVQPLNNTTNNVTNIEKGTISDPIMGTPTTVQVSSKSGKSANAVSVVNAVNPFDESLSTGSINASPMEVLISLKESLVDILNILVATGQTNQANASMTAKVVDAINNLNNSMGSSQSGNSSASIFGPIGQLARGE